MEKKAKEIVKIIKEKLNEKKKKGDRNTYSFSFNYISSLAGYSISVNYEPLTETLDAWKFKCLIKELTKQLNDLQTTKGWDTLTWENDEINLSSSCWSSDYIKIPNNFTLFSKPCNEFKSLTKYIEKHCGKTINLTDIYSVAIGGKRGRVYGEESDRYYLAYNPNKCLSILQELRDCRCSRDIINTSAIKQVDDIDDWELECSIRNEVEFSGVRYKECNVTIQTPNGKTKKIIRVGM